MSLTTRYLMMPCLFAMIVLLTSCNKIPVQTGSGVSTNHQVAASSISCEKTVDEDVSKQLQSYPGYVITTKLVQSDIVLVKICPKDYKKDENNLLYEPCRTFSYDVNICGLLSRSRSR